MASLRTFFVVAVLMHTAAESYAVTRDLNLTGVTANASVTSGQSPGAFGALPSNFTTWALDLTGLDPNTSFQVAAGDLINIAIRLDQSFLFQAVPTSFQDFSLRLSGTPLSIPFQSLTQASFTAFNGQVAGPSYSAGCSSAGSSGASPALCGGAIFSNVPPIQFDSIRWIFQVSSVSSSFSVGLASLSWSLVTPIPEPASYLLMFLGMATVAVARVLSKRRTTWGAHAPTRSLAI